METSQLKKPAFIVGTASLMLLLVLALRGGSSNQTATQFEKVQTQLAELKSTVEAIRLRIESSEEKAMAQSAFPAEAIEEFDEALTLTEHYLQAKDFISAYDMLLVASRIAPSDPRLFEHVTAFVEKAKDSDNEELLELAEDLLDRGDSLVHFQVPKNVQSSRRRLTELRQIFLKPPLQLPTDLDGVRSLLIISTNPSLTLEVRSQAAEHARNALDNALLELAGESGGQPEKLQTDEIKELSQKIDRAEQECIAALFGQMKPNADKWMESADSLRMADKHVPANAVPDFSRQVSDAISQGFDHLQELMPYSKSGVPGATDLSQRVERQIKSLQRLKSWLYNQQVLRLVREVESKKEWSPVDKIRNLAPVEEELLLPYVTRRHNEAWEKAFESLPNEEMKVWATRLRILRTEE